MAVDKLVDSAQLDADLTSVADAIRLKSGGSSPLSFPAGFISEIANIPAGYTAADWVDVTKPSGSIVSDETFSGYTDSTLMYTLAYRSGITSIHMTSATFLPRFFAYSCKGLLTFVSRQSGLSISDLQMCSNLTAVDINGNLSTDCIRDANRLTALILRKTDISTINANSFRSSVFGSGRPGATIYIPKSLYDHLGDGSALDYKAAANWDTYDGYGTITWAQIEGSYYEDHYADGTLIMP